MTKPSSAFAKRILKSLLKASNKARNKSMRDAVSEAKIRKGCSGGGCG